MHRAALAAKAGAKFLQYLVGVDQYSPEPLDVFRIVGSVMAILVEGSSVVEFLGCPVNLNFYSQRSKAGHVLRIEVRHRTREQRDAALLAHARLDHRLMRHEVELHVKRQLAERNWRSAQSARSEERRVG